MRRIKGKETGEGMWEAMEVRVREEACKHLRLFWVRQSKHRRRRGKGDAESFKTSSGEKKIKRKKVIKGSYIV